MERQRREEILKGIGDAEARKTAEEHPECLHPCVWLVKDEKGPLVAGGRPRLPVGREWPREEGRLLAYLMAIDASLLPEWSPLPRDCGTLLVFVGHVTCEIVVVGRGVEARDLEPPLEEYVSAQPTAGDVLESVRFRLEEGLHAGVPESWSVTEERPESRDYDYEEALGDLNRALAPEESFGRLFGRQQRWVGVDPGLIAKYSYLDVNGYRDGWYQDLEGPVEGLERELEAAKQQRPPEVEKLPAIAGVVVEACEKWVAEAETKVALRREVADARARQQVEIARATMARRRKRWEMVKGGDPAAANKALEELITSAAMINHEMEHIPIASDPEQFNARLRAIEDADAVKSLQWSERTMANLKEEVRIKREHANDPEGFKAAMKAFEESKGLRKGAYSELLQLLTPMQYACRENNCEVIRKTWQAHDDKLTEVASELKAGELSTGLHWRLHGYESLVGWSGRGYVDPKQIAGKIAAIQWWQKDVAKHEAELAHWLPLLVMDSGHGPYEWGDAGWAIVLADEREVAKGRLGRLAIAVDVS